jgi:ABC-type lipoprotein export system ATPase subunit
MSDYLVIRQLTKRFRTPDGAERTILDGISCGVAAGETVAVLGPSGSGKSTLLNIIGALDSPTAGSVRLGDTDVAALKGPQLAQYRASAVGFVFQDHHLLPQLSALENVLLPTLALPPDAGAPARAEALLEAVGVAARREAFPVQMSGGERQRVAVARALINGAGLLLCDEPTGNLDRESGTRVIELLLDLAREEGTTVLMVTHNAEHAGRFSRRLELRDGRLSGDLANKGGLP